MHVHLRTPGAPEAETLETGLRAALAGGVTTVGMMPNTTPPLDDPGLVETILRRAESLALAEVVPIPCVTAGGTGGKLTDLEAFRSMGIRAFSDDGRPVLPDESFREACRRVSRFDGVIIEHPENPDISGGGVVDRGPVAELLGLPGIPEEAEWSDAARCVALLEGTGGRLHLTHLSSPESVRIAASAAARGLPVTCDATPHHLALNHDVVAAMGTRAKMNPPLRSEESRRELARLCSRGMVQAVASDHAPHTRESKERSMAEAPFGVIGLETLLPVAADVLWRRCGTAPLDVAAMLTTAPASILGIRPPDLSREGSDSMVLFDPGEEWEYSGGFSLSVNSPFLGTRLTGRVVMTVFRGRIFQ
jgi:dihydroorotase